MAIAGAAGPAVEMVRLFQVQLEHYEKVEGVSLSLEGKANQLAQMVRAHLPLAMQGLAVVPLFAGYDLARRTGRIFTYDVTGGHYEEADFQATGSGGRDARQTIKLGFREAMTEDEAVELAIEPLFQAADEDAGTGGPDLVRGIYPLVAVVDADGYRRIDEADVAERFGALIERMRRPGRPAGRRRRCGGVMTMPFYVAPEQVMKDRAEYAQKGIARGRSLVAAVYDEGVLIVAENPSRSLHKVSEIYDRIAFAGVGKYNEYDQLRVAGVRHADTKGYAYSREDVDARSLANVYAQFLGNVFTHEMKPLEHRSQYGFRAKIEQKTGEIAYGFAKYLRDALPNASFIGFTGTPIEKDDVNTPAVFGEYIDVYDISRAVEDAGWSRSTTRAAWPGSNCQRMRSRRSMPRSRN